MGGSVRIGVLGTTSLHVDGRIVELSSERQRRLLLALAVDLGSNVPADRLIERIWGEGLPDDPRATLRTYLSRLRQSVGEVLVTDVAGWRLDERSVDVDARRFDRLVASAAEPGLDVHGRLARLDEALALWLGEAYQDVSGEEWVAAEASRLEELRLTAIERRYDAMLAAGMHTDALPGLSGEVETHPLRDRLVGLQMLALYRSGRQAEATRVFEQHRRRLADEIGLDPGADLVELDRRIVVGDPSLALTAPAGTALRSYRLGEQLGEGAFAVVYRGTQPSVGRDVAVKVIRAELANRPEFVRRFEAEAHLVARLEHPYVVPLYDYWREPDRACLVFRYLRGGTLEARLTSAGALSLGEAGALVEQIGSALAAAHAESVVHRDVKPANVFLDEAGNFYLGDFGIALEAAELSDPTAALSAGSPAYASPEQLRREPVGPSADVHGLGITLYEALTGRLPFPDAASQAELLQRQLNDPIPSARERRADLPDAVDAVIQRATAKHPADRYQRVEELVAAFAAAVAGSTPATAGASRPGTATMVGVGDLRNPYKGLRAFTEADTDDFHGRERLVDRLLDGLAQTGTAGRIAAVVGPSGIGKSSVVRAGLLPRLRSGRIPGSDRWFVATMLPGRTPFDELASALLRVAAHVPENMMGQLTEDHRGIARTVKALVPDGDDVLLVIDQFEELFTLAPPTETARFLDAVEHAVTDARCPLRVVLTMRADFWDRPLRHGSFARLIEPSTVHVTALAPDELERAIVTPAHRAGVEFEPGLVAEIVADVNDQPGALPLLQYALTELWERRTSGVLARDAYRELGGVTGALARRAEDIYTGSPAPEQDATRRLFGRLVTLGEGTEDVRRRIVRSEVGDDPATGAAIEAFGGARLLSFDHDPATREPTVEVAHEALIREWPRLRGWLDDDRDGLRMHRHLTVSARAWRDTGRDAGELYRGGRLEAAEVWAADHDDDLNPVEREFLDASVVAHDAELEAERQRFDEQVQHNRRLRILVAVATVIAVVAAVAGVFALQQRSRADDEAATARDRAADAEQARQEADESAAIAAERAGEAEAARREADDSAFEARQQADAARAAQELADLERIRAVALATAAQDPSTAALLAVEAYRLDPSIESLDALHRVLTEVPGYHGSIADVVYGDMVTIDETTIAAAGGASVDVWDLARRELIRSIPHDGPGGLGTMTRVGTDRVAVVDRGRTSTTIFDLGSGAVVATIQHDAAVGDVAATADGTRLAAGLVGGDVEVWTVGSGEPDAIIDTGEVDVSFVRWHPGGELLAVVLGSAVVQLWEPGAEAPIWATDPPQAGIVNQLNPFAAAFDPIGGRFAFVAGSLGPSLRIIDAATGLEPNPAVPLPILRNFTLDDLEWRDGDIVVVPSRGSVVAVDLSTGVVATELDQFIRSAFAVRFSPALDQYVIAGLSGLEFWSTGPSGPLERIVPLTPEQSAGFEAGGGPILAALSGDGSRLITSVFKVPPPIPPTTVVDLSGSRPTATVDDALGVVIGYGDLTLNARADFTIQILDRDLGPLGPPVPLPFDYSELGVSDDGRFLTLGRQGGLADVHRIGDGALIGTISLGGADEFAGTLVGPWFTSDGDVMSLTTTDGRSGIWRTEPLERLEVPEGLSNRIVYALGDWLFAQEGSAFQRWDPETLQPVGVPIPLAGLGGLGYPRFDRSHLRIVAGGTEVAKVFDLETGRQLGRDLPYNGGSTRVQFTADGSLLAVPADHAVALWNFDTDTWADIACRFAGRNLTADEWARFGPRTVEYRATCDQYGS